MKIKKIIFIISCLFLPLSIKATLFRPEDITRAREDITRAREEAIKNQKDIELGRKNLEEIRKKAEEAYKIAKQNREQMEEKIRKQADALNALSAKKESLDKAKYQADKTALNKKINELENSLNDLVKTENVEKIALDSAETRAKEEAGKIEQEKEENFKKVRDLLTKISNTKPGEKIVFSLEDLKFLYTPSKSGNLFLNILERYKLSEGKTNLLQKILERNPEIFEGLNNIMNSSEAHSIPTNSLMALLEITKKTIESMNNPKNKPQDLFSLGGQKWKDDINLLTNLLVWVGKELYYENRELMKLPESSIAKQANSDIIEIAKRISKFNNLYAETIIPVLEFFDKALKSRALKSEVTMRESLASSLTDFIKNIPMVREDMTLQRKGIINILLKKVINSLLSIETLKVFLKERFSDVVEHIYPETFLRFAKDDPKALQEIINSSKDILKKEPTNKNVTNILKLFDIIKQILNVPSQKEFIKIQEQLQSTRSELFKSINDVIEKNKFEKSMEVLAKELNEQIKNFLTEEDIKSLRSFDVSKRKKLLNRLSLKDEELKKEELKPESREIITKLDQSREIITKLDQKIRFFDTDKYVENLNEYGTSILGKNLLSENNLKALKDAQDDKNRAPILKEILKNLNDLSEAKNELTPENQAKLGISKDRLDRNVKKLQTDLLSFLSVENLTEIQRAENLAKIKQSALDEIYKSLDNLAKENMGWKIA